MVDFFKSKEMESNESSVKMTNFPIFFGSWSSVDNGAAARMPFHRLCLRRDNNRKFATHKIKITKENDSINK